jgi:hypothetical protein
MAKPAAKSEEVIIQKISTGVLTVNVLGTTPLIFNRMSEKAWRELLLPAPPKNRASRASVLKHEPFDEYRASVYQDRDEASPTALMLPVQCFKGAATTAALDMPGSNKSQMGRLLWIRERWVSIYGVPEIYCSIVRQAGMNRTPDVRTRAILPTWAARFVIEYVEPIVKAQSVINLLAAGGLTVGVGDFRQEKGKGNFGQFVIVDADDERYLEVMKRGREEQLAALADPVAHDEETAELLGWFTSEVKRRGFRAVG